MSAILVVRNLTIATVAIFMAIVAAFLVLVAIGPAQNGYTVAARTEVVDLRIVDPKGVAAVLPTVEFFDAAKANGAPRSVVGATLEAPNASRLTLRRKREGVVFIGVDTTTAKDERAQLILSDGSEIPLPAKTTLAVSLSRPETAAETGKRADALLLAFQGEVRIGDDVARLVEATLLEGDVSIVERGWLFGERFVVREAKLDPGDRVIWRSRDGTPSTDVSGFVQAGYGDALRVTAHGTAQQLEILRLGVQTFHFSPLPWDRVARNPIANITAIILGLIATGFGVIQTIVSLVSKGKKSA